MGTRLYVGNLPYSVTELDLRDLFGGLGTVTDANGNAGTLGSVGVTGGMPTEANVTSGLATVGTGAFSIENGGEGNTGSTKLTPPPGGSPSRVNWREVVPNN